jgi:hypothetical protein
MLRRVDVADYAADMARELAKMAVSVELNDLAYILDMAALEADGIKATETARAPYAKRATETA